MLHLSSVSLVGYTFFFCLWYTLLFEVHFFILFDYMTFVFGICTHLLWHWYLTICCCTFTFVVLFIFIWFYLTFYPLLCIPRYVMIDYPIYDICYYDGMLVLWYSHNSITNVVPRRWWWPCGDGDSHCGIWLFIDDGTWFYIWRYSVMIWLYLTNHTIGPIVRSNWRWPCWLYMFQHWALLNDDDICCW